jgi:DNA-binding transcriptional ArsR family regulator
MRRQILDRLSDREASPNMIAKELDQGLSQVSYHFKVLKDFDCIRMVRTEPRRGAVEHFYAAVEKSFLPSWRLKDVPKVTQQQLNMGVMEEIEYDIATSLEAGTFGQRKDTVVAADPAVVLDDQGCQDAEILAAEFFERLDTIKTESTNRLSNGESDKEFVTSAVLLVFGSAVEHRGGPKKRKRSKKRK